MAHRRRWHASRGTNARIGQRWLGSVRSAALAQTY